MCVQSFFSLNILQVQSEFVHKQENNMSRKMMHRHQQKQAQKLSYMGKKSK